MKLNQKPNHRGRAFKAKTLLPDRSTKKQVPDFFCRYSIYWYIVMKCGLNSNLPRINHNGEKKPTKIKINKCLQTMATTNGNRRSKLTDRVSKL